MSKEAENVTVLFHIQQTPVVFTTLEGAKEYAEDLVAPVVGLTLTEWRDLPGGASLLFARAQSGPLAQVNTCYVQE